MLSEKEEAVLVEAQRFPLTTKPFTAIAKHLHLDEDEVLTICKDLLNRKIIRRFGPSIAHKKIGFMANPMTVIKVPSDKVNEIGQIISAVPEVTHCYARSGWEYNLFFMIHARTKEEGVKRVKLIMEKIGDYEYQSLFSLREFKKIPFEIQKSKKIFSEGQK